MSYILKITETRNMLIGSAAILFTCVTIIGALIIRFIKSKRTKSQAIKLGVIILATLSGLTFMGVHTYKAVAAEVEQIKYIEIKTNEYEKAFSVIELSHEIEFGSDFKVPLPNDLDVDYEEIDYVLGENIIPVTVKDDIVPFVKEYKVNVIDTTAPVISGVKDLSTEKGKSIDLNSLEIKAHDTHDGDVEVKLSHDVDFDKEGDYTVTVTAVDQAGNEAKETFNVNVYMQGMQTIKFHKGGRVINYYNKGASGGQRQIDSQPGTATTWTIGQHVHTHSNTDGRPTYMAGHYYDAFIPVTTMQVGDRMTVRDHNGHMQTYEATSRYLIGVDQSTGVVYGNAAAYNKIYSFNGEGIMLQTCVANNPSVMIVVETRPV